MHVAQQMRRKLYKHLHRFKNLSKPLVKRADAYITFFPDYSINNPYQSLLYHWEGARHCISSGSIQQALRTQRLFPTKAHFFHLHWVHDMVHQPDFAQILQRIQSFQQRGGTFIWTIHNIVGHETPDHQREVLACAQLAASADKIHIHYPQAAALIAQHYPLDENKIVVIPHGSYLPSLRQRHPQLKLEAGQGGSTADNKLFFSGGNIRPYKNLEQICTAFAQVAPYYPHACLQIRGKRFGDYQIATTPHAQIDIRYETISDEDFYHAIHQSYFCVLSYEASLTSGMMLFALSCGTPIIAPDMAHFSATLDEGTAILYTPGDPQSLSAAIRRACELAPADYLQMRKNAFELAQRMNWDNIPTCLFRL
jgi:glycosyltransferase involved in cell wall biosynthesis